MLQSLRLEKVRAWAGGTLSAAWLGGALLHAHHGGAGSCLYGLACVVVACPIWRGTNDSVTVDGQGRGTQPCSPEQLMQALTSATPPLAEIQVDGSDSIAVVKEIYQP